MLLDVILDTRLDETALDCAMAVIEGLRMAICASTDPMPLNKARHALAHHLDPPTP